MIAKYKVIVLAAAMAAVVFAASCKKEEDTALPSLTGTLRISGAPLFVAPQTEVTFTINKLTHPDGGKIGYSYSITEGYRTVKDTLEDGVMSFTYKFSDRDYFDKDTLRTVSITAQAFADGYYTTYSSSALVTIVKDGVGHGPNDATITWGNYDGSINSPFTINNVTWAGKRNIADPSLGIPYMNEESMRNVLGGYYTWDEAKMVCSNISAGNCRLANYGNWMKTITGSFDSGTDWPPKDIPNMAGSLMVNAKFNMVEMWPYWPEIQITNSTGMSIIPAGYATLGEDGNGYFEGINSYAVFWLDDELDTDKAYCIYIYAGDETTRGCNDVKVMVQDKKTFCASVRCVY